MLFQRCGKFSKFLTLSKTYWDNSLFCSFKYCLQEYLQNVKRYALPFTEKINQPNISEAFITLVALNVNFEQFYHNQKQIISLG